MITRRNIRVKIMQTLYSLEAQDNQKTGDAQRILQKHFDQSGQLLIYLIFFLTELARYAETDSLRRSSKHLPSELDKNVNTKLAGNQLLWKILEQESYQKIVKKYKPELNDHADMVRKLYLELRDTDVYRTYISENSRDRKPEKEILEYIFNDFLLPNEAFESHLEEIFPNWGDDAEMMQKLVSGYLNKTTAFNFEEIVSPDKALFARELLSAVLEKKEVTMELIRPKLKNWDADRIATLDMIFMQMGVCEFLFFETIPPKVTINEYIDLAKDYSTPLSGQFVNGILDNIHKDLVTENKMHKVNFKTS
ncbi:MAG TPA: transcription antitermination factor NusB [Puia sp.]|jgi:N utilization substance protein B|nr:transcription antitermination factor NusB [Puia sp.]